VRERDHTASRTPTMAMAKDALYAAKAAEQKQQYLDLVSAKEDKKWPLLSASERETLKKRVGRAPQHPAPRRTLGHITPSSRRDVKFFEDRRVFEAKVVETYNTMVLEKQIRTAADPPVPVLTEAVVQVAATTRVQSVQTVRQSKEIWWVADEPDECEAMRDPRDGWINDEEVCECLSRGVVHDYWRGCRSKTIDGRSIRGRCDCVNSYEFHSAPCNQRYDQRPPLVYEDRDAWAAAAHASASASAPVPVLTEAVVQVPAEIPRSRSRSPSHSSTRSRSRSSSPIPSPSASLGPPSASPSVSPTPSPSPSASLGRLHPVIGGTFHFDHP